MIFAGIDLNRFILNGSVSSKQNTQIMKALLFAHTNNFLLFLALLCRLPILLNHGLDTGFVLGIVNIFFWVDPDLASELPWVQVRIQHVNCLAVRGPLVQTVTRFLLKISHYFKCINLN